MTSHSFLAGGGEAGAALRAHDWNASGLGEPDNWSGSLKTIVQVMLNSDQPMLIAWGERLIALYNDAHAALIGDRQHDTLGRPLFEVWSELSSQIEPLFRKAMAGEASRVDDLIVPLMRGGFQVAAHFSISYTPVRDDARIGGVLCLSTETTAIDLAQRRKATLLELSDRLRSLKRPRDMVTAAVDCLGQHLAANRVGYGEVQTDGETILLETSYVDGVEPISGLFQLESFGSDNIARQRQGITVVHHDVLQAETENHDVWASIETRSFASVPLIRDGRLRASLYVNFRKPHPWHREDVLLIEEVAARIWDALERARAEDALRASEARFRAAVGAIQGILWTNNASGEMEDEQTGWAALTGQSYADYHGYGWASAVHPDDAQATIDAWRLAVSERRPFLFEHRLRRHDGVWRRFSIRALPIFDESDEIQEWVGVHSDITDQRAAEEALRQLNQQLGERIIEERVLNAQLLEQSAALVSAQESLRTIFNASSEGLALSRLIRDDEGRVLDYQVLDVNPAHLVLGSIPREQMLAKPVSQIAPPIDPRWLITAEKAVRTGEMQSFEVRNRFNGRWLDIHVSPVSGDLFAQTFIDVTARHEAEEQRARLIAEMNHRVMNNFQIVAGILGLQARRSQNPDVSEQLTNAVRRVHLLAELHEKLAFAPETGEVDFAAYLCAVCDRLRASIDEPDRVQLKFEADAAKLDVTTALPLGFIVNELVTNAIKYAFPPPSEGEIHVTFRHEEASFSLRVADGGAGLSPNVETKGTGLGMRLVSSFVEQIKGTLEIRHVPGVEYVIRFPTSVN